MIAFSVPMIPTAKGRPRAAVIGRHARIYTPAETERAERQFVAFAAPHAPAAPLGGPVRLRVTFVLPLPISRPAWWREAARARLVYPTSRPDADNLAKLVLDALNRSGRFWRDDAQVVEIVAAKQFGDAPETRVELEEIAEPRSAAEWKVWPGRSAAGLTFGAAS